MRSASCFLACVAVVSSHALALAQPAAPTGGPRPPRTYDGPSLTLRQAIDEVLAGHPDLAALRAEAEVAAAGPLRERTLMPPMFEGQVFQWPFNTASPANAQIMLTLSQEFPGRGKRDSRAALAEKQAAMTANQVSVRTSALAGEVRRAYADLYLARQSLEIFDATIELLQQLVSVTEAKYATGRTTQQDIVKALVEIARVEEQIVMATEDAGMAEIRLNTLLNRAPDAPVGPINPPDAPASLPDAADLQRVAREGQPELRGADLELAASEAARVVAESETKPDWVVRGGYMFMPEMTDAWTATVSMTWPRAPWARKRIDAETLEAQRMADAARARRHALERRVAQMVQEALLRAKAARDRVELLRTSVLPQLEHSFDLAVVAYQTDRLGFGELLDTERMLLDARLDYHRALNRRDVALADLDQAVGQMSVPDVDRSPVPSAERRTPGVELEPRAPSSGRADLQVHRTRENES